MQLLYPLASATSQIARSTRVALCQLDGKVRLFNARGWHGLNRAKQRCCGRENACEYLAGLLGVQWPPACPVGERDAVTDCYPLLKSAVSLPPKQSIKELEVDAARAIASAFDKLPEAMAYSRAELKPLLEQLGDAALQYKNPSLFNGLARRLQSDAVACCADAVGAAVVTQRRVLERMCRPSLGGRLEPPTTKQRRAYADLRLVDPQLPAEPEATTVTAMVELLKSLQPPTAKQHQAYADLRLVDPQLPAEPEAMTIKAMVELLERLQPPKPPTAKQRRAYAHLCLDDPQLYAEPEPKTAKAMQELLKRLELPGQDRSTSKMGELVDPPPKRQRRTA